MIGFKPMVGVKMGLDKVTFLWTFGLSSPKHCSRHQIYEFVVVCLHFFFCTKLRIVQLLLIIDLFKIVRHCTDSFLKKILHQQLSELFMTLVSLLSSPGRLFKHDFTFYLA